jgi:hypothetical protein
MTENVGQYRLSISSLRECINLKDEWLSLEANCHASFFLSWTWISAWLTSYQPDVDVLRVHCNEKLVSLALLTRSNFYQWKRFASRRLHIHQTGVPAQDQIWTEYNGILSLSEHEEAVYSRLLPYLVKHYPDWDELLIGAITRNVAAQLEKSTNLTRLDLWHSPSYGVDLKRLQLSYPDYLSSLSRNTRYQIRRSFKIYDASGGLSLHFATDVHEAILFFREAGPLHLDKWGEGPGESGYSNPEFVSFHESLIRSAFPLQQVDLIKVCCGNQVIGYLYNYLYHGRVYFYLSGLSTERDAKLKPGLCAHSLAIQHYIDKGFDFYDFMGGQDRYKASLGEVHAELFHIALQKDQLKFKIEAFLRSVKQSFTS